MQRFKRKEAKELKESGISPTKTELDEAIEQIIAMEESADEQHDLEDGEKRDKMEGDRLKAEEMRRTAMETLGKTQKRKSEEGQSKAKKSRRSGSEMVEFLKLKAEQENRKTGAREDGYSPKSANLYVQPNVKTTAGTA